MKEQFFDNRLYGGYYLFIKDKGKLTDDEVLNLLEISNKGLSKEDNQKDFFDHSTPKAYITESGDWKHIIDNYCYWVFNHLGKKRGKESKKIILGIAKKYELFEVFISDVDETFFYKYYSHGELLRHYSVGSLNNSYSENFVEFDIGEAREDERRVLKKRGQDEKVLDIAKIYGVEIFHEIKNIRCYNLGMIYE